MEVPRKPPGCGFNKAERNLVQPNKFNNSKPPHESGGNKPKVTTTHDPNSSRKSYLATKTIKVKYWDPTFEVQKSQVKTFTASENEDKREKIRRAMLLFDEEYERFCEKNQTKPKNERIAPSNVPLKVAEIVQKKLNWMKPEKIMGPVCGVQIGDTFKYRSQLMMVGLHTQPMFGIDFVNTEGKNVAISIVDAHRYSNKSGYSNSLVYSGEGGNCLFGGSKSSAEDQKLEKGNLALKNSKYTKNQVRVIRKVKGSGRDMLAYDGLYIVDDYTSDRSANGKTVFKFYMKRVPGQPSLHKMLKRKSTQNIHKDYQFASRKKHIIFAGSYAS